MEYQGADLLERRLALDGAGFELQATLSAEEARGLKAGDRLAFETDLGGERGEAVITALVPGADPVSHRSGLRARVARGGDRR